MTIFAGGIIPLLSSVWLVRSEVTVTGVDYMEGMIPHYSVAILTSKRARISDPCFMRVPSATNATKKPVAWLASSALLW